jgi:hypothetical protein
MPRIIAPTAGQAQAQMFSNRLSRKSVISPSPRGQAKAISDVFRSKVLDGLREFFSLARLKGAPNLEASGRSALSSPLDDYPVCQDNGEGFVKEWMEGMPPELTDALGAVAPWVWALLGQALLELKLSECPASWQEVYDCCEAFWSWCTPFPGGQPNTSCGWVDPYQRGRAAVGVLKNLVHTNSETGTSFLEVDTSTHIYGLVEELEGGAQAILTVENVYGGMWATFQEAPSPKIPVNVYILNPGGQLGTQYSVDAKIVGMPPEQATKLAEMYYDLAWNLQQNFERVDACDMNFGDFKAIKQNQIKGAVSASEWPFLHSTGGSLELGCNHIDFIRSFSGQAWNFCKKSGAFDWMDELADSLGSVAIEWDWP